MDNEKICKNCEKQINGDFKFCPYCGAKNEKETPKENSSNIFCSSCGKSVNKDFNVCPFCGEKLKNQNLNEDKKEEKIFCKNCGRLIKNDFKICPHCKVKISNETENEIQSKAVVKSNTYFSEKSSMVCLILMVCVGWAVCAHRFYVGRTTEATVFLIANLSSIIILMVDGIPILIYIIFYLVAIWLWDLIKLVRGEFKDSEGKYLKKL